MASRFIPSIALAAIGHRRGAANILGINFSGFFAWFLWRGTYLWKLPRPEKKIRVAVGWAIDLFFSRDLVQLMTLDDLQRITAFGVQHELTPQSTPQPAGKSAQGARADQQLGT